ncbi:hypothetical protein GUITHDRAFT_102776 [Guillardia theta CCMP2712]|uniref:FAST kinase leucine-rich domain-containing protein n=1 Tax=Guillardia theta (strain CCMP2712) TaxID=905079 RepID=L1JTV3_GUITC|nr:hypothetical protein GUITHDRAFT_102776 [Guillardia theta CCMP2712]EKX51513.1 hypothetical protein GUITHDRAFT_102776 [Guillardia theta CCMP2712]|eukprot:XP_005838493.1 hypothetical protein GUITHDRAFT_102776 [Guillardia theta CCMP2712]
MSRARSIAHDLNTKQLSRLLNSLMSLSRVGFDNMRIILEITRLLSKSLYELTAKRAARTFHSIAKLGVPDKISINVCASLVLREKSFRRVDVAGLSQLVEGAGYLSTRRSCQKVVIVMVEKILKTLNSNSTKKGLLTAKDWFRLLMGLGRLRFRGEDSTLQSLIDHFGHQDQLLEAYKPWEIAHICWSLTSLGCQERWIVQALAKRFCQDVDMANLQGAVFVLWSMGVLGVEDDAVLEKLSRIICSKASRLTAHNLVHCVAAFHKLSTVRKDEDAELTIDRPVLEALKDFPTWRNSSFTFDEKSDVRIFQAYKTKAVLASRLVRKCLSDDGLMVVLMMKMSVTSFVIRSQVASRRNDLRLREPEAFFCCIQDKLD